MIIPYRLRLVCEFTQFPILKIQISFTFTTTLYILLKKQSTYLIIIFFSVCKNMKRWYVTMKLIDFVSRFSKQAIHRRQTTSTPRNSNLIISIEMWDLCEWERKINHFVCAFAICIGIVGMCAKSNFWIYSKTFVERLTLNFFIILYSITYNNKWYEYACYYLIAQNKSEIMKYWVFICEETRRNPTYTIIHY